MAAENDPKTVNERMPIYGGKLDVIGKNATDDEVQREAGDVIGQDLTGMPRNDVQAVLYAVDHKAGLVLGPDVVKGVIALAALLA